jgi:predicted MFS family arabinose efflux permease
MNFRINPWLLVALLWVVALLNYLDRQVIFSLFPLLQNDLRLSSVELGLLSTVFLAVYGALSPFAGYLADRFGRGRLILISLVVWSVVTWATGHARNINELLAARALMGISEACYLPAALALIVERQSERYHSLATGLHQSGLYTGMILGGAWGGWMGEHYGWRPVFTLLGAAGVAYFILLWFVLRGGDEQVAGAPPRFASSLRRLLTLRGFIKLTIVFSAVGAANWLVYTWLPMYLYERFHISLTSAGFSATFYIQAASYAGILLGGWLADRWMARSKRGRILVQTIGLAAAAPFLLLIGFANSYGLLVVALLAFGLGRGFYDCSTMPVLSQIAAPDLRATGYGVFNFFSCLVGGVAAAGAGYLKSTIGLSAAFLIASVVLLFGSGLLVTVPIGKSNEPHGQEAEARGN